MSPWGIVAAVVAALGIFVLVVYGGEGRDSSGRGREGIDELAAQQLVGQPVTLGPESSITIVLERGQQPPDETRSYATALLPPETVALLEEVRDLLASTAGQTTDQARPALEQALDRLDLALDQIDTAAEDTSNDVTKIRLLQLHRALESVRDWIETKLGQS